MSCMSNFWAVELKNVITWELYLFKPVNSFLCFLDEVHIY